MYRNARALLMAIASGSFAVLVGLLFIPAKGAESNLLKVHFLDVGQGDAIFIEAPNGKQVLIDGGRPDNKVLAELAEIMPIGDRTIDIVVATHPDADHVGGLTEVLKRYKTKLLLISQEGDTSIAKALLDEYRDLEISGFYARQGMRFLLDAEHGIVADILFPDRDVRGWEANAGSIIMRLTYGEQSFLFTGDAEAGVEGALVKAIPGLIDVDVLKLGHHGSKTSSSEIFLKAVTPEIAIISAGKNNSYGHPAPEVMARLKKFSIPSLSTQDQGTITFVTDGTRLSLKK